MKLLIAEARATLHNKNEASALNKTTMSDFAISSRPDSCLQKGGKPFFMPDYGNGNCTLQPSIAVRIGCLGKSIAPRWVHRYIDSATLCALMQFADDDNLDYFERTCFDGSVELGEMRSIEDLPPTAELKVDEKAETFELKPALQSISPALAAISSYNTVRQGDLLILPLAQTKSPVKLGQRISGKIGTAEVLRFNIR